MNSKHRNRRIEFFFFIGILCRWERFFRLFSIAIQKWSRRWNGFQWIQCVYVCCVRSNFHLNRRLIWNDYITDARISIHSLWMLPTKDLLHQSYHPKCEIDCEALFLFGFECCWLLLLNAKCQNECMLCEFISDGAESKNDIKNQMWNTHKEIKRIFQFRFERLIAFPIFKHLNEFRSLVVYIGIGLWNIAIRLAQRNQRFKSQCVKRICPLFIRLFSNFLCFGFGRPDSLIQIHHHQSIDKNISSSNFIYRDCLRLNGYAYSCFDRYCWTHSDQNLHAAFAPEWRCFRYWITRAIAIPKSDYLSKMPIHIKALFL